MCMLSPELPTPREAFPDAFGLMETGAPVLVAEAGGAERVLGVDVGVAVGGVVPLDCLRRERDVGSGGDVHAATDALAVHAAGSCQAALGRVASDHAVVEGARGGRAEPDAAAPAGAAVEPRSAGAALGTVADERTAADDEGGRVRLEIVREVTEEVVDTNHDAAAPAGAAVGSRAPVTADGLVADERAVGDGHGRIERIINAAPEAEASRDAGSRSAGASDGLVADERAAGDGRDRAERIVDAAAHAGATATGAGAALGKVADEGAVRDSEHVGAVVQDASASTAPVSGLSLVGVLWAPPMAWLPMSVLFLTVSVPEAFRMPPPRPWSAAKTTVLPVVPGPPMARLPVSVQLVRVIITPKEPSLSMAPPLASP